MQSLHLSPSLCSFNVVSIAKTDVSIKFFSATVLDVHSSRRTKNQSASNIKNSGWFHGLDSSKQKDQSSNFTYHQITIYQPLFTELNYFLCCFFTIIIFLLVILHQLNFQNFFNEIIYSADKYRFMFAKNYFKQYLIQYERNSHWSKNNKLKSNEETTPIKNQFC